jgi:hypothetical protein
MAKSRDKRGREDKKKKKPKKQALTGVPPDVAFRHHAVATPPAEEAPRPADG